MKLLPKSLGLRLIGQLAIAFVVVALGLFFTIRLVAEQAVQSSQDQVLAASVTSILAEVSFLDGAPNVDIPYGAFAMLGAVGDDLVYYRVQANNSEFVTGYPDLPLPDPPPPTSTPVSYSVEYKGHLVRVHAAQRALFADGRTIPILAAVAQTQDGQAEIIEKIVYRSAAVGLGFLVLAVALSWLAMRSAMSPVRSITATLRARTPQDLKPIEADPPREIAPMVDALNSYLTRTRGTLDQMEQFIAEGAHRIRTPLTGIRAQAEIAMRNARQDRTREAFRKILQAVDQTARTAGQMLDQAMTAYRINRWEPVPLDLRELVERLVEESRVGADLRDMDIAVALPEQPAMITGDAVLLAEGVRNLIDNAIKYAPPESLIRVELVASRDRVAVSVEDQGPGIEAAELEQVTRRFARGSGAGDTVGSGLGLHIVELVATAHGGQLRLHYEPGHGLRATIELPGEVSA